MSLSKVSVVIPVYNSERSLPLLIPRIIEVFEKLQRECEIVLVDDSSPDNSWEVLKELKRRYPDQLKIIRLLKNSGQHNAILCGFSAVTGEIIVTMDDDLQNPPEDIPILLDKIEENYDLVIGSYEVKQHSGFRNLSGRLIDAMIRNLYDLPKDFQLTSFRAAKRVVIDNVTAMGGVYPYITCMLLSNSSHVTNVPVSHEKRQFGQSNYTLKRSLSLAANLLINYSSYPIYLVGFFSLINLIFSVTYALYVIFKVFAYGISVPGWASTVVIMSFFNALTLTCLFVFALYLYRFNQQFTRTRLSYTIRERFD